MKLDRAAAGAEFLAHLQDKFPDGYRELEAYCKEHDETDTLEDNPLGFTLAEGPDSCARAVERFIDNLLASRGGAPTNAAADEISTTNGEESSAKRLRTTDDDGSDAGVPTDAATHEVSATSREKQRPRDYVEVLMRDGSRAEGLPKHTSGDICQVLTADGRNVKAERGADGVFLEVQ